MDGNKRADVAEWYLVNVWPYVSDKEAEVEWLVEHLKNEAFELFEADYDEQMSELPEFTPSKIIVTKNN